MSDDTRAKSSRRMSPVYSNSSFQVPTMDLRKEVVFSSVPKIT